MPKESGWVLIKIPATTRRLIKVQAVLKGMTMQDYITKLAVEKQKEVKL